MIPFLKRLFKRYGQDDISTRAASLSYFTIFSVGPMLFVVFGVLGELLKSESYRNQLITQVQDLLGPQAGSLITTILDHQTLSSKTGPAFIIGGVGLVLGAIGIFGQLRKGLDNILHVKIGPDARWRPILKQKIISLALVGVICFLLLISLVASAMTSSLTHHFDSSATSFLFQLADYLVSVFVFTVLLTAVYRTLPEVKLPWKILFTTSLIIAVMFSLGKSVIGLIIGNNGSITAFGAAGSLIALLLWIFYTGQIIYMGASGISVYAETHDVPFVPRYGGKRGVLRVKQVEEPLGDSSITNTIKQGFIKGFKKGLKSKK
jgi:membrane protein